MAQVKLGFSRFSVTVKILRARWIVSKMTGNPHYPSPEPGLAIIENAIAELELAAQEAIKGGTDKTLIKDVKERQLDGLMNPLQSYVQVASKGDAIIIESSGMEVKKERTKAIILPPIVGPTANVGDNSGEIMLNWAGMKGAKSYVVEMQINTDSVSNQSDAVSGGNDTDVIVQPEAGAPQWIKIDTVTVSRLLVKNLVTGKMYHFRIAAINSAGQGAYSQTVSSVAR